ncbi:SulA-like leucine-rich domain-containing protein [Halioxenophilus aromaticivorans]|uniref:Cell division inhibitor SulA n=1 Tax=Halioxenophilus aromaticivorans TaxID=1306992 RepID=A0AAV3TXF9_9ALTE
MAATLPLDFEVTTPLAATPSVAKGVPASNSDHITELLVSKYCPDYLQLLLPMLSHQSRIAGSRWITWIANSKLDKQLLESFGVDTQKVRFVYPRDTDVIFDLVEEALVAGNSHCVVAVNENFLAEQMHLLNSAAKFGNAMGILVSHRD